jgi:hypothetical protein
MDANGPSFLSLAISVFHDVVFSPNPEFFFWDRRRLRYLHVTPMDKKVKTSHYTPREYLGERK